MADQFGLDWMLEPVGDIIICDNKTVVSVMKASKIPIDVRTKSMFYNLFDHTKTAIDKSRKKFEFLDFAKAEHKWGRIPHVEYSEDTWMVYSMVFCLAQCYNIGSKFMEEKIWKRLVMACESVNKPVSARSDIADLIKTFGRVDTRSPPFLMSKTMLGYIVCVTKNGEMDTEMMESELMSPGEMQERHSWTDWTRAVYEQLRLATMNMHTKSLRTGIAVIPILEQLSGRDRLVKINNYLKEMETDVWLRPWVGLCDFPRETRKVRRYPIEIMFGLYYKHRAMGGTDMSNVHIPKSISRSTFELLPKENVKSLLAVAPPADLGIKIRLLEAMDVDEAESAYNRLSRGEQEKVVKHFAANEVHCPLGKLLNMREETKVRKDVVKTVLGKYDLDQKNALETYKVVFKNNYPEYKEGNGLVESAENLIARIKKKLNGAAVEISVSIPRDREALTKKMLEQLRSKTAEDTQELNRVLQEIHSMATGKHEELEWGDHFAEV